MKCKQAPLPHRPPYTCAHVYFVPHSRLSCPLHQSAPSCLLEGVAPEISSFALRNAFPLPESLHQLKRPLSPTPSLPLTKLYCSGQSSPSPDSPAPRATAHHSSSLSFLHSPGFILPACVSSAGYLISELACRCPALGGHLGSLFLSFLGSLPLSDLHQPCGFRIPCPATEFLVSSGNSRPSA